MRRTSNLYFLIALVTVLTPQRANALDACPSAQSVLKSFFDSSEPFWNRARFVTKEAEYRAILAQGQKVPPFHELDAVSKLALFEASGKHLGAPPFEVQRLLDSLGNSRRNHLLKRVAEITTPFEAVKSIKNVYRRGHRVNQGLRHIAHWNVSREAEKLIESRLVDAFCTESFELFLVKVSSFSRTDAKMLSKWTARNQSLVRAATENGINAAVSLQSGVLLGLPVVPGFKIHPDWVTRAMTYGFDAIRVDLIKAYGSFANSEIIWNKLRTLYAIGAWSYLGLIELRPEIAAVADGKHIREPKLEDLRVERFKAMLEKRVLLNEPIDSAFVNKAADHVLNCDTIIYTKIGAPDLQMSENHQERTPSSAEKFELLRPILEKLAEQGKIDPLVITIWDH